MTLALTMLWFSPVADAAAATLGSLLPKGTALAFSLSLAFVATGVAGGVYLVRHYPALGATGAAAAASDWLGLPTLITVAVVRPVDALARAAAWADDHVIDAGPRGVAVLGRRGSTFIAAADNQVVDQGIRWTAVFGDWLARVSDRFGEAVSDGIPEGTARLTGMIGHDLRRLQTGFSHRYYAYIIGGVFVVVAILAAGA
jgi:hypothetical protein